MSKWNSRETVDSIILDVEARMEPVLMEVMLRHNRDLRIQNLVPAERHIVVSV